MERAGSGEWKVGRVERWLSADDYWLLMSGRRREGECKRRRMRKELFDQEKKKRRGEERERRQVEDKGGWRIFMRERERQQDTVDLHVPSTPPIRRQSVGLNTENVWERTIDNQGRGKNKPSE